MVIDTSAVIAILFAEPSPLPVFREGTGLAPHIDPLSNRSLLDGTDEAEIGEGRLR